MAYTLDQKMAFVALGVAALTFIAGLGVALGMDVRTKGEYVFVICCFGLCAIALTLTIGIGLLMMDARLWLRIPLSIILIGGVWTGFFGVLSWVNGRRVQESQGFNVRFKSEFVDLSRNTDDASLWVLYPSGYGQTISPVSVMTFLEITNLTSRKTSITNYSLSIKTEDCGWVYLSPISSMGSRLLFGYKGIQEMSEIDASQSLDQQLKSPLEPDDPRFGLLMFDTKVACSVHKGSIVQFKLELMDSSGKQYTFLSLETALRNDFTPGSTMGEEHVASFNMLGHDIDASRAYRRMRCDPVPAKLDPSTVPGMVVIRQTGRTGTIVLQDGAFVIPTQQRSMQ